MTPALDTLLLSLATHGELSAARCLFVGAQAHPELPAGITGWQPHKSLADDWTARGGELVTDLPDKRFPLVLVLPGKSRDETLAWFALARNHLEPGGHLVVAMPNTAGAGRFEKALHKATGTVSSIQKHKCRAFHATDDGSWNESLFAEWRELGQRRTIPETTYQTEAGIFSCDHIDPGSQLLADHLPKSISGSVADLGAGWGFLSDHALNSCRKIHRIDLYEADARALDCARNNLSHHPQDQLGFHWHDVRQGIDGPYDTILMNPPFHSGQHTDVDLGRTFIRRAAKALRPGGQIFMVANKQLPYEAELDTLHLRWQQAAENAVFKLLFARKP